MEFEIEGISCLMNKSHEIYLFGMVIDWENGLNNRGFTYKTRMQHHLWLRHELWNLTLLFNFHLQFLLVPGILSS